MLPEALLVVAMASTSTVSLARRWQVEAAGWERLSEECAAELVASRSELQRKDLVRSSPMPAQSSLMPALLGGLAGAGIAGGVAAGLACPDIECRGGGITAGAVAVVAAVVLLLSQ